MLDFVIGNSGTLVSLNDPGMSLVANSTLTHESRFTRLTSPPNVAASDPPAPYGTSASTAGAWDVLIGRLSTTNQLVNSRSASERGIGVVFTEVETPLRPVTVTDDASKWLGWAGPLRWYLGQLTPREIRWGRARSVTQTWWGEAGVPWAL